MAFTVLAAAEGASTFFLVLQSEHAIYSGFHNHELAGMVILPMLSNFWELLHTFAMVRENAAGTIRDLANRALFRLIAVALIGMLASGDHYWIPAFSYEFALDVILLLSIVAFTLLAGSDSHLMAVILLVANLALVAFGYCFPMEGHHAFKLKPDMHDPGSIAKASHE